jgi:hypothetical protein
LEQVRRLEPLLVVGPGLELGLELVLALVLGLVVEQGP